jgi:xeroderma pigmentosum group C-complementing protein
VCVCAQAYWEAEHAAAQKEQEKRHQAVLKRWTKLVHGLRIRQRMREQYGTAVGAAAPDRASGSKDGDGDDDERADGGGFLTRADDVVQHHNLPRPVHVVFASPPPRSPAPDDRTPTPATSPTPVPDEPVLPLDSDSDVQHPADNPVENRGIPKSMAELAAEAEAAAAQMSNSSSSSTGGEAVSVTGRANKEGRTVRPRGKKRVRARESEDEDDWQSDDGDSENARGEVTGRTRDAKRVRTRARARAGRPDRPTIVPVQIPTSDRVLRTRKK